MKRTLALTVVTALCAVRRRRGDLFPAAAGRTGHLV